MIFDIVCIVFFIYCGTLRLTSAETAVNKIANVELSTLSYQEQYRMSNVPQQHQQRQQPQQQQQQQLQDYIDKSILPTKKQFVRSREKIMHTVAFSSGLNGLKSPRLLKATNSELLSAEKCCSSSTSTGIADIGIKPVSPLGTNIATKSCASTTKTDVPTSRVVEKNIKTTISVNVTKRQKDGLMVDMNHLLKQAKLFTTSVATPKETSSKPSSKPSSSLPKHGQNIKDNQIPDWMSYVPVPNCGGFIGMSPPRQTQETDSSERQHR